jgi:hypothetical protein
VSLKSAPFYWLECDGCGERCEYGDFAAYADPGPAIDEALEADWTTDGEKYNCPDCPTLTKCDECGKPAEEGAADRDGLCIACDAEVQKDAPNPAVTP